MSIRDELLKWANDEQARGNQVSIQEIAEHAQGLAQKQEAGALRLLADIRVAAGDPHGRLMQDELVDHIVELNKKVSENDALARELEVERHHRRAAPPIGTRYRNTDNEVVAVVAPRILPREVFEEASVGFKGADYHGELGRWIMLHDFLPEPD